MNGHWNERGCYVPLNPKICILVAGMHRSGTSAATRVINLLGADITRDLMPTAVGVNDRGYWESRKVADIHDRLLHALGSSYDDPLPLPDFWFQTGAAREAKRQLADEIKKDFSDSDLFVIKDPRITRLLPLWLSLLGELETEAVVAIPVRNPLEVAASLNRREGLSAAQALHLYIRSYLEVELASWGRRRFFIRYDQLLSDWRILETKLAKYVGHSLRPKQGAVGEICDFLTYDLYHNRITREDLANDTQTANTVIEMFDSMCSAADCLDDTAVHAQFDRLRATVDEATKLFRGIVIAEREKHHSEVGRLRIDHDAAVLLSDNVIASMQSRVNELQEALGTSSALSDRVIASIQSRVNELQEALETSSATVARLNGELEAAQNRVGRSEAALQIQSGEATKFKAALSELRQRATELAAEVEIRSQQFSAIRASTSWRLTEPVRWIAEKAPRLAQFVRRLRQRSPSINP